MNYTQKYWNDIEAREKRHKLRSLCAAIEYNITALSIIPAYPENESVRAIHERELELAIEGIKDLLK